MNYRDQLLRVGRAYAEATGLSMARVATLVRDYGGFFKRLEAGGGCTMDTYAKCMRWFAEHWPAGTAWPEGVERPAPQPAAAVPPQSIEAAA